MSSGLQILKGMKSHQKGEMKSAKRVWKWKLKILKKKGKGLKSLHRETFCGECHDCGR